MHIPRYHRFAMLSGFILLVAAIIISSPFSFYGKPTFQAIKGFIDISSLIHKNQPVNLKGEWTFFYNEFLSNEEIQNAHHKGQSISVPKKWELSEFETKADPIKGHGTYHLQVKIGHTNAPLALHLPIIGSSYRLYIDDELYASVGEAGLTKSMTKDHYQQRVVPFNAKSDVINLTFQVSNFQPEWGGIRYPISIGPQHTIIQKEKVSVMKNAFLGGFLFSVALYNLILFMLRRSNTLPLVFSLVCFTLGLREFFVQNYAVLNYFPNLSLTQLLAVDHLTFYLGAPLIMHFNYLSFPTFFNKRFMIFTYVIGITLSIFLLAENLDQSFLTVTIMQLLAPIYIAYVLFISVSAFKAKQKGAAVILSGSIVMGACVINDILYAHALVSTGVLGSVGLTIYVVSQSYMTGVQLNQALQYNESLSKRVTRRNITLENMMHRFETKVKDRTAELADANANLKKIAQTDPLTQVPNRYGMLEVIKQEEARFKRSGIAYSIATLDIDHFKKINDKLGHDSGDDALVKCAQLIKENIRQQDKLARWGGEEFIILLPETPLYGATIIAEKIRNVIYQSIIVVNENKIRMTVTIGVVETLAGESFDDAFKRSDIALFKGKEKGRNIVIV